MITRRALLLGICGVLASQPALAVTGSSSHAVVLQIGFGSNKPPYVFESERRGLEVDLIVAAARRAGMEVQPFFAPMERLQSMLQQGRLDGIATTNPYSKLKAYFSQPYLEYHNVAVALTQRKLVLHDISDLSRYAVSTFQRARQLLGPQFEAMASSNPRYREEGDQQVRNQLLYAGRVDVIVGDWRIISYFNQQLPPELVARQPITVYPLFAPTPYQMAFRHQWQRDNFDRGLQLLRQSGGYHEIETRYQNVQAAPHL
ncbi:substrate-binding periplasmic protein [Aquitalea magnusonii]|uniref:substrate-binding periplasmic protein n=1 Tax=Aquitalea magnusonii TaxID=332411 RepID=UPI000B5C7A01|nr:transporter substrate-binding domain-containing protein [Aquitalea magnusonii]